ncbi:MAG: acetyl-CoA carboxylase, carboxyltransferase subunit beta [Planctomycetota bacterium]
MAWARFKKKDMPGGLWTKCPSCSQMIFAKDLEAKKKVCSSCNYHFQLNATERIAFTVDEGSFEELYPDLEAKDRLNFKEKGPYSEKLKQTMQKTGRKEAMVIGPATIKGRRLMLGVLDFSFLGGSMGAVVGEKVTLAVEEAIRRHLPLVLVSASGGARMHEGAISLMQMAKTCAALARFEATRLPYIAVLADPTTGGVTASWATVADIILAEPAALIGFAGPRVIQTTLRQELPEGFQRSEFLLKRGQIDRIVTREELPDLIAKLMDYLSPPADAPATPRAPPVAHSNGKPGTDHPDPAKDERAVRAQEKPRGQAPSHDEE